MSVIDETCCGLLLAMARTAIAARLHGAREITGVKDRSVAQLDEDAASFVTLESRGQLRGCIGSLFPLRPLGEDVQHNAVQAALHDPRFDPLGCSEPIRIRVSVLSPLVLMSADSEADLLEQLQPDRDGLLIRVGHHQATFLPEVWRHFETPEAFLAALKQKAGLSPRPLHGAEWAVWRYSTQVCTEPNEQCVGPG